MHVEYGLAYARVKSVSTGSINGLACARVRASLESAVREAAVLIGLRECRVSKHALIDNFLDRLLQKTMTSQKTSDKNLSLVSI